MVEEFPLIYPCGVCGHEERSLERSEEGAKFLGDGVTRGSEPPNVGARN